MHISAGKVAGVSLYMHIAFVSPYAKFLPLDAAVLRMVLVSFCAVVKHSEQANKQNQNKWETGKGLFVL